MSRKSGLLSLAVHAALAVLLLLLASLPPARPALREPARVVTRLYVPQDLRRPAGGGSRSPLPASRGAAPKLVARKFVPPVVTPSPARPLLAMTPTLAAPPDIKLPDVQVDHYGDPFAAYGPPSGGTGGPAGAGGVGCCGIGPGSGPNIGGAGGAGHRGRIRQPRLVYMVEPEYSDEARKSRFQGTVILKIVVDAEGHARQVRVVRGLGLGLDEKAVQAVGLWRFEPAEQDGKAVPAPAIVEVNFHLL